MGLIAHTYIPIIQNFFFQFNDSVFDNSSGRFPPMPYESIRAGSSSTSIFENLQAQLKQRDGKYLIISTIFAIFFLSITNYDLILLSLQVKYSNFSGTCLDGTQKEMH